MVSLDLGDIQGLILRGYGMPAVRHLILRVENAVAARRFLGALADGGRLPQVTSAKEWDVKPVSCLNVSLTFEGLRALELREDSLASFPEEFAQGAASRAPERGEPDDGSPIRWACGLGSGDVHVLFTISGVSAASIAGASDALATAFAETGALRELSHCDGHVFPANFATPGRLLVHFSYSDGFSQPVIEGAPTAGLPDHLPPAPAGEFLLGYPSQHPGFTYPVPAPAELGLNGSFGVLHILRQDVEAFEGFLSETSRALGIDKEKLAAKVLGRWRNGVPLVLSPDTDSPEPPIATERYNDFDYTPSDYPGAIDDARGYRCPVGSHIRRANPRSHRVAGGSGHLHRIIRRGLPYGPPYDSTMPPDGIERGLLGLFICVSIKDQFEFIMREWINDGLFAGGLGRTKDPLIGSQEPESGRFVIPEEGAAARVVEGFSAFVTTKGIAYCFLPSLTALRYLASIE
jgi:deferrochelatase/peroxidase EfeB